MLEQYVLPLRILLPHSLLLQSLTGKLNNLTHNVLLRVPLLCLVKILFIGRRIPTLDFLIITQN